MDCRPSDCVEKPLRSLGHDRERCAQAAQTKENKALTGNLEARVGIEHLMVLKTKQIPLESVVLSDENLNIRRGLAQF